jgi:hypothetical protein
MSELQQYYNDFCATLAERCPENQFEVKYTQNEMGGEDAEWVKMDTGRKCSGWFVSEVDTVHQCPLHPNLPNPNED